MTDARLRRSVHFVPGANEKMLTKSLGLAADSLVLDLEDAVTPDRKDEARSGGQWMVARRRFRRQGTRRSNEPVGYAVGTGRPARDDADPARRVPRAEDPNAGGHRTDRPDVADARGRRTATFAAV